jgi:hypothetical protein
VIIDRFNGLMDDLTKYAKKMVTVVDSYWNQNPKKSPSPEDRIAVFKALGLGNSPGVNPIYPIRATDLNGLHSTLQRMRRDQSRATSYQTQAAAVLSLEENWSQASNNLAKKVTPAPKKVSSTPKNTQNSSSGGKRVRSAKGEEKGESKMEKKRKGGEGRKCFVSKSEVAWAKELVGVAQNPKVCVRHGTHARPCTFQKCRFPHASHETLKKWRDEAGPEGRLLIALNWGIIGEDPLTPEERTRQIDYWTPLATPRTTAASGLSTGPPQEIWGLENQPPPLHWGMGLHSKEGDLRNAVTTCIP